MPLPLYNSASKATEAETRSELPTSTSAASGATGAGANNGAGVTRPKTEQEIEADRLYEEAMEEEYAKREGGA